MKIIITESQLDYLKKRSFFSKESGDFSHEINENLNGFNLNEVEEIVERLSNTNPEIIAELSELVFQEAGYHGGTLGGKSDYLDKSYRGDMPFTGYYFIGDALRAITRGNRGNGGNHQFRICDFSKYKLLRPGTEGYWKIKNSLKRFENRLWNNEQEYDTIFRKLDSEMPWNLNITPYKDKIKALWDEWVNKYDGNYTERFETAVLKLMGYEGVDVRGSKDYNGSAGADSFTEGSCIFDLKEGTYCSLAEAYIKAGETNSNRDLRMSMGNVLQHVRLGKDLSGIRISPYNSDWI